MGRARSTTLVFVGDESGEAIEGLGRYRNVRAAAFSDDSDDDVERWISQAHEPYVVHNRDPLGHVAAAWVEFFDDLATIGTLDLEVDRALAAFGQGKVTMPDYYVVLEPERLAMTWKHWWLGVLPQASPTRVIPWEGSDLTSLARVLRTLPTSRQWPSPDPWLRCVARAVPDRVGMGELPGIADTPETLGPPDAGDRGL